ncbi:hypothetical protein BS643_14910 [Pseudomonas protegens]|uniref:hypothetical protein n=1 Tax=Pseudomonas TaxID=286 RepID=UPI00080712F0|nr:hypothetical protein [Pseudomonas protegens]OBZ25053.1 hypothetical protein BBH58_06130 [Pseudomonas protegens]OBZ31836.1 hypothetical protein BBH57_18610 [Pseudomonas protegens]OKK42367.1 hypothetical protein BS644_17490 [Pseudomonas protegens]OKK46816.1 hypothetical protein BS643_14910 [Pseudomonas protegens]OKK61816.1 hypothetical protein BS645_10335 [Pseudomonas protegens]
MQPKDLKNSHVRLHYTTALESTNNLVFVHAITAASDDQKTKFPGEVLGWGSDIKTWYDYRMMFGNVYARLFQLCVISLCSDIELFFKQTFEKYNYKKGSGKGFYQRFNDVIATLKESGHDFSEIEDSLIKIDFAFQVRHICIHNYGIIDEDFLRKTKVGSLGQTYEINQEQFRTMFDAYEVLLKHLDSHLP